VIVVAPRNSKYRSDELRYRGVTVYDYVHPHVASLATAVVDDFIAAGEALAQLPLKKETGTAPAWLEAAVREYRQNVLAEDKPMLEALAKLGLRVK
jgi:hypothetical protein